MRRRRKWKEEVTDFFPGTQAQQPPDRASGNVGRHRGNGDIPLLLEEAAGPHVRTTQQGRGEQLAGSRVSRKRPD